MRIQNNGVIQGILLGVVFVVVALFVVRNQVPTDIVSPYLAGWFFDHNLFGEIYGFQAETMFENTPPTTWVNAVETQGAEVKTLYPYLYPPIWAALLAPLTRILDISQFSWLFYIIQVPLIYGSIYFAWRICNQPVKFLYWALGSIFLVAISIIGLSALAENQPHIFVTFLIIFGLERWLTGHSRWAGFLLALAATIKIFPVFLIIMLFAARDWRAAGHMIFWGLLIAGLSFFLAGFELHYQYLDQLRGLSGIAFLGQHNLSISGVLYQLSMAVDAESIRYGVTIQLPIWISLVNLGVLGIGLGLIAQRFRKQKKPALIVAVLLLIGLTSPFGWSYYYLPLLYFWPLVFVLFSQNKAVFATYGVFTPLLSLFQNQVRDAGFYNLAQTSATLAIMAALSGFFLLGARKSLVNPELTSRVD